MSYLALRATKAAKGPIAYVGTFIACGMRKDMTRDCYRKIVGLSSQDVARLGEEANRRAYKADITANRPLKFVSPAILTIMNFSMVLVYWIGATKMQSGLVGLSTLLLTSRRGLVLTRDLSADECRAIWDTFLRAYLYTADESLLAEVTRQVAGFARARHLLRTLIVDDEGLHAYGAAKRMVLAFVDAGVEPLCF